jgi:[NiFe] hydrogenase assembly HybE family chaperone
MTEAATLAGSQAPGIELPHPAAALERAYGRIWKDQMQGVPMLNPALRVQALGFAPWQDHWLGVMVTPWFMNLMLLPRVAARWQPIAERESRHYRFPAGVFEFIGGRDAALGDFQACSLFSPMFDFADHAAAAATAEASLAALFDAGNRPGSPVPAVEAAAPAAAAAAAPAANLSKRSFLFGTAPRADRGA